MSEEQEPWRADVEAFVAAAAQGEGPVVVGIDPGSTGAIGLWCGQAYTAVDIPVIKVEVRRTKTLSEEDQAATGKKTKSKMGQTTRFDFGGIVRLFQVIRCLKSRITVVLEEIPPSLGPGKHHAEVMLARAWAIWPLFIQVLGYPLIPAKPSEWKKALGLLRKEKEASRHMALGLFPKAALHLKKHVDRAEALLLCRWYRLTHLAGVGE